MLNDAQMLTYNLKIRVPAQGFETMISTLEKGDDEILSKNITARDVTEEFLDIEGRLKNKRNYLKKYTELLSKTNQVKDILEIEENIRVLQEEIEQVEGRLKYLSDQVMYSTLEISLEKEKPYVYKPGGELSFWERLKSSFGDGWTSSVAFVLWIISIWPFAIFITVFSYFGRKWYLRRKNNKKIDN